MVEHQTGKKPRRESEDDDRLDLLFHAMADRTRRAIVTRLAQGPASVSELASPFSMTLPGVSKHIRVLERAGLVSRTRTGGVRRCALMPGAFVDANDWLERHRALWNDNLRSLARYVEDEGEDGG